MPDKVCEKIQIAKKMALDAVEAAFLTLESEVINKLNDLNESKDVYSVDKSHKMDKLILSHLDQLYALQDGLRGDRGLSNLIFFLREKQDEVNKFHSDVSSYLNVHASSLRSTNRTTPPSKSIVKPSTASMPSSPGPSKFQP